MLTNFSLSLYNNYRKEFLAPIFRNKATGKLHGCNKIVLDEDFPLFSSPLLGYEDSFVGC